MVNSSISVHVGTALQGMTENNIPATPHRVLDLRRSRQSIGFFLEPGLNAQMGALSGTNLGCEGTYGWHLRERFQSYGN